MLPSLLGLDAPLVALGWAVLIAEESGNFVSWTAPLSLFLVVWFVYLADRLFDGFRAEDLACLAPRHRFARRNWLLLVMIMLVSTVLLLLILAPKLDRDVLIHGLWLGLLTVAYFIAFRLKKYRSRVPTKEIAIGTCFALGILVAGNADLSVESTLCGFTMATLFTANCLIISFAERDFDRVSDPSAHFSDASRITGLPSLLLAFSVGGAAALFAFSRLETVAATSIIASLWTFLLLKKEANSPDAIQPLADAVLLLPWIAFALDLTLSGQ